MAESELATMIMGRSLIWAATALVLGLSLSRTAQAEESAAAHDADASFQAGRAFLKDKRYAEACQKFEESQREDPASGTLLALAYCRELSGSLATSWASYLAASQLAEREGRSDRQQVASERAQALAARVSRVTLVVPQELATLPGLSVQCDGVNIEPAAFGSAVPTDGGSHVYIASAPDRLPWKSTVTVLPERDQKTLVVPGLSLAFAANAAPTASLPLVEPAPAAQSSHEVAFKRASLAFAAASVVGLGFGTGFALSAGGKNSDSDRYCNASGCDDTGIALRNDALTAARAATWSFVAAGAMAACSITFYLTAGGSSARAARAAGAHVSLGGSGIALGGSF